MKPEYYEVKCGNCRFWHSWKSFARKNERSVRRAVQKGAETGCDGKCCCYESGMDIGPRDSSDKLSASHCDFYSAIKNIQIDFEKQDGMSVGGKINGSKFD